MGAIDPTAANRTDEEWAAIIDQAYKDLPTDFPSYDCPDPGTAEFAQYIDHTLLKEDATTAQIQQICEEAKKYQFKSVCVRLPHVSTAVAALRSTPILVACVVGFHEGTQATAFKVQEALSACSSGASELDMVIPHTLLHTPSPTSTTQSQSLPSYSTVYAQLLAVRNCAPSATVKVILETSQLSLYEIVAGCVLCVAAGADFVKTSTGFLGRGASVEDVRVMRAVVGKEIRVKASGGLRDGEACRRVVEAGATRLGASAGVAIMEGSGGKAGY